jgi:SagB-type dehydrogenase family enzyme
VETSIRKRRSPQRFAERPIERAELEFVVALARGTGALRRVTGLDLHVFVHRVRDLGPGLYGIDAGGRLEQVRSGELGDALVRACRWQTNAGRAAAGFAVSGRLDARASALGSRAYRDLLLDAGAIGQRIYLSAEAQGLAARNLAAFTDEKFNDLLGLDGRRRAGLHLTMLGASERPS